jgi:hypothetical protein
MLAQKWSMKMLSTEIKKKNGKVKHYCYECGELISVGDTYATMEVYDSPWDQPKAIYVHVDNEIRENGLSCEEALYNQQWADFRYFNCHLCNRTISRHCRSNGWHSYVREYDSEEICLSCYEEIQYKEGASQESFENGHIEGMFFNYEDLTSRGFERVDNYQDYYIRTTRDAKEYCETALRLINHGYIIVNEYVRMAIGGLEGYVTMWCKLKEVTHERQCA